MASGDSRFVNGVQMGGTPDPSDAKGRREKKGH